MAPSLVSKSMVTRELERVSLNTASQLILFVADVLHPIDNLAVQSFLNGDVSHSRGRCSPVPMLLPRREPNHISGTNFLDLTTFPLNPPAACRDN